MVASKGSRNKTTGWTVNLGNKIVHVREGSARVIYDKEFSDWYYYSIQASQVLDVSSTTPDEFTIKYTYGKQLEYTIKGIVKGLTITWSNDE